MIMGEEEETKKRRREKGTLASVKLFLVPHPKINLLTGTMNNIVIERVTCDRALGSNVSKKFVR